MIVFRFEALNKWSLDEIVVTAAYENGELHVVGSRYMRESDITGLNPIGTESKLIPAEFC